MTTGPARTPTLAKQRFEDCPLPDPPKSFDMQQRRQLYRIDSALIPHFSERGDVLVCGEGYLRRDAQDRGAWFAPDCVVAFGVDPDRIVGRNGYVISEAGKPPDFAMEVASRSTGWRDYTIKREAYARYRVLEYWRADESGGRWHDAPLAGDRLVDGKYVPIAIHREPSGLLWGHSEVLGLDVCWDKGRVRFYDPVSARYLPDAEELKAERDAAVTYALTAEAERDAERFARLAAEAHAMTVESEVRRLREQLRRRE